MPDPKLSAIGSLTVGGESTFATEAGFYDALRVVSVDLSGLERVTLANEFTRQGDYETARILGGSKGAITTRHRLHGFNSSIPSAAPALTSAELEAATAFDHLMAIIGSAFGQVHAGGYAGTQTVASSGSPVDTLITTLITSFKSGQAVAWATDTTRRAYEVGWLKTVDASATPDEAELLQTPKRNPQGATVWGSYTAFVRDLAPFHDGACKSWTLKWLGGNSTDAYTMYGCQPTSIKITMAVNQVPVIEIGWGVAHWEIDSSGGPPSVESWSYPEPEAIVDWQIMIGGITADMIYPVAKEVTFDLGLTRNPMEGGHSSSGVEGWFSAMRRPKLTISTLWDSGFHTDFGAQTAVPVTVQFGSQPGRIIALCLPAARLVSLPKRGDRDGMTVLDLEYEAHYYEDDGGSDAVATYPRDSLARIAFL